MTPQQIEAEAKKLLGKGLNAAAIFLKARVKEELSQPAQRVRVLGRDGAYYYRAATKATPGAPPRKLSGRLRASITHEVSADGTTARVGTNVVYGRRHEKGSHPFLVPVLKRHAQQLGQIIAGAV